MIFGSAMIGVGISQGIRDGFSLRMIALVAVVSAGCTALAASAITWLSRRGNARLTQQGIDSSNTDPVQERTVEVQQSAAAAFEASLSALNAIPGMRVLLENRATREIGARTGMGWRSFGESVTIRVARLADDRSTVRIRSEPRMKATMVDYGKSVENVELFLRQLSQRSPRKND
ncbi:MAG TPA: hypothetical protein VF396_25310 [Bradyrhizobium sp.]